MPVAMAGEFVAARVYFSHQLWKTYVPPIRQRKTSPLRCTHQTDREHVVAHHDPRRPTLPTIRETEQAMPPHEIVFDVDTHYVRRWQTASVLCPSFIFGQREIHQFPSVPVIREAL